MSRINETSILASDDLYKHTEFHFYEDLLAIIISHIAFLFDIYFQYIFNAEKTNLCGYWVYRIIKQIFSTTKVSYEILTHVFACIERHHKDWTLHRFHLAKQEFIRFVKNICSLIKITLYSVIDITISHSNVVVLLHFTCLLTLSQCIWQINLSTKIKWIKMTAHLLWNRYQWWKVGKIAYEIMHFNTKKLKNNWNTFSVLYWLYISSYFIQNITIISTNLHYRHRRRHHHHRIKF